eukprot:CAMPEP_0117418580 /NCGR_PEP_ID=MMETSP0758-20121206/320_1 /TAXON_ID=63605 /ORGANISM="Percolomonas cosmopolitus, Strain AE-1 (ATCC 50343)" /LENGTH=516 /DNA_ID=CAMNT_0005199143 /DNA_START=750 /DNA_END=2300 /DNA_ORIENTATION=-
MFIRWLMSYTIDVFLEIVIKYYLKRENVTAEKKILQQEEGDFFDELSEHMNRQANKLQQEPDLDFNFPVIHDDESELGEADLASEQDGEVTSVVSVEYNPPTPPPDDYNEAILSDDSHDSQEILAASDESEINSEEFDQIEDEIDRLDVLVENHQLTHDAVEAEEELRIHHLTALHEEIRGVEHGRAQMEAGNYQLELASKQKKKSLQNDLSNEHDALLESSKKRREQIKLIIDTQVGAKSSDRFTSSEIQRAVDAISVRQAMLLDQDNDGSPSINVEVEVSDDDDDHPSVHSPPTNPSLLDPYQLWKRSLSHKDSSLSLPSPQPLPSFPSSHFSEDTDEESFGESDDYVVKRSSPSVDSFVGSSSDSDSDEPNRFVSLKFPTSSDPQRGLFSSSSSSFPQSSSLSSSVVMDIGTSSNFSRFHQPLSFPSNDSVSLPPPQSGLFSNVGSSSFPSSSSNFSLVQPSLQQSEQPHQPLQQNLQQQQQQQNLQQQQQHREEAVSRFVSNPDDSSPLTQH